MGNALDAAKFSIEQGNTGVGTKKTLLEGIDNFAEGVQTWKDNIDSARLKLKTDTATKYREAEKEVYENLPSDKTDRDLALKALANYKDRLYANMGLVQAGMIKPEDNLIFQENGKQSFEILANQINDYATRREETLKRAKGGFIKQEDGTEIYVDPQSGAYEAALQDLQSRMGNPEFTNVSFGENGMGQVTFYKTEVDELTGTRVLVKDSEGNPIPIKGLDKMSVLSFDRGRNQRADRIYLDKEVAKAVGPNTQLGQTFETMSSKGLMVGTIEDNQKANPQLEVLIDDATATLTATPDRIVSILCDNGLQGEQSIPLNVAQWENLTDAQRNEKITYSWVNAKGETQTGTKSKYIKLVTSANGQIVPELSKDDRQAAENVARTSIYSALKKDITDKGTKRSEFDPLRPEKTNNDDKKKDLIGTVDYAKMIALGGKDQASALEEMKQSGLYTLEKGYNQILSKTGVKEVGEGDNKRKAEVYTVQTPTGRKEMFVYHTDVDGKSIDLEGRTRQTIALLMQNPTQTKDAFNTYKNEGYKFDETYDETKFIERDNISFVDTNLSLDSTVSGTGAQKVTLNDGLTEAIKVADKDSYTGFTGSVLASGVEENLTQALLNSGQKLQSSPKVRFDRDKEIMTITAVNNKGKTITITRGINDESNGEAQKVKAMVTEFLSNINSDEDYTSGKGKFD